MQSTTATGDTMTATAAKTRRTARRTRKPKHATREQWLTAAVELARPLIEAHGVRIPRVRVSVGFPKASRGKGSHAIGQCWTSENSGDRTHEIFISPELEDGARVLDVEVHELVHAAVGIAAGHRGEFARVARAVGLEGRLTATVAGEGLKAWALRACRTLGAYPHATLIATTTATKQTTRMRKVECDSCGFIFRTTTKWIEETGLPPQCACGGHFDVA